MHPTCSTCLLPNHQGCRNFIAIVRSSHHSKIIKHRLIWSADNNQQTVKPVFSVSDELVLLNFRSVLRKGYDDHALLSAFMLTFTFSAAAGRINRECLKYQNEALSSIRQRMNSLDRSVSESTLGAILLLAGIEVRITSLFNVSNLVVIRLLTADIRCCRLSLECHVTSNFIWAQYSSFSKYVEERGCT